MLFTKECDYGARIIRHLANGELKTVSAICDTEKIPIQYSYKIMKKLENAGLLKSSRGQNGGYQLARPLDMITLHDIAIAVDENFLIFECVSNNKFCSFHKSDHPCTVHLEFNRLQNFLVKELKAKTMQEVLMAGSQP